MADTPRGQGRAGSGATGTAQFGEEHGLRDRASPSTPIKRSSRKGPRAPVRLPYVQHGATDLRVISSRSFTSDTTQHHGVIAIVFGLLKIAVGLRQLVITRCDPGRMEQRKFQRFVPGPRTNAHRIGDPTAASTSQPRHMRSRVCGRQGAEVSGCQESLSSCLNAYSPTAQTNPSTFGSAPHAAIPPTW